GPQNRPTAYQSNTTNTKSYSSSRGIQQDTCRGEKNKTLANIYETSTCATWAWLQ
ncbi:hypothetical protein NDU88_007494, partial [Pleurodeles waltl]